ncbi:hypothetical protein MMC27_005430 [Xylographa pallens]|nr:hypothetical protein [Xylographa pallens]
MEQLGVDGSRMIVLTGCCIRLNAQHFLWQRQLRFHVHSDISLPKNQDLSIADVGTGTGAWLFEVAGEFASNTVFDGFDISTAQFPDENDLPANISLKILDIGGNDLPDSVMGKYDLVHIRLFAFAVLNNDPTPILKNLVKMLKPGGWLQWSEADSTPMKRRHLQLVGSTIASKMMSKFFLWTDRYYPRSWVPNLAEKFTEHGLEMNSLYRYPVTDVFLRKAWLNVTLAAYQELSYKFDNFADPELGTGEDFRLLIEGAEEESAKPDVVYDPVRDIASVEEARSEELNTWTYPTLMSCLFIHVTMYTSCQYHRKTPLYFLVLLSTLAVVVNCRAVQSNDSLSTYNRDDSLQLSLRAIEAQLSYRALSVGAHQLDIPGTAFKVKLNVRNSVVTRGMNTAQVLAKKILHDAQSLSTNENLGQAYNVWPEADRIAKFELRRLQPRVKVPILGRQLLEIVSQLIKTSFHDHKYSLLFAGFDGTISFLGEERFSFRAFALPETVANSEKVPGVEFGAQDLDAIFSIKLALLSLTIADDLLIFVGNTGRYILPAFSSADPAAYRRKVAFIPVSGLGGSWRNVWTRSGVSTDTDAGNANFANTVLRPIFTDKALMPTNAGRIIFIDHARTGQSINALSTDIQDHDLVPFADPRLRYINLLYKTKHEPPLRIWSASLLANIPVEDEQMARLDLATVGRVTPYYCSLYWEDNWEVIPYPDRPGSQGILDQVSARATTWAKNPPPIPPPPQAPPVAMELSRGPGMPVTPGTRPRPLPPTSPFERRPELGPARPSTQRPGSRPPLSPFERVAAEGRGRGQSRPPAAPSSTASALKPLRLFE